jgi:hypothetical protein
VSVRDYPRGRVGNHRRRPRPPAAREYPRRRAQGDRAKSHTEYKTLRTDEWRAFVRITEDAQRAVDEAGIAEGMILVSAMHITAGVWANDVARALLPDGGD